MVYTAGAPQLPRVLILTGRTDAAERIVRTLHRARIPVRGLYTQHPQKLPGLVAEHPCALIISCIDTGISAQEVATHYCRIPQRVPLLVVMSATEPSTEHLELMRAGGSGWIEPDDARGLVAAVRTVIEGHALGRRLEQTERALTRCRQHLKELIDDSPDAVVWLRDGIQLDGNAAYRRMLDLGITEAIPGRRFVDEVAAEQREEIEALVAGGGPNADDAATVTTITLVTADNRRLRLRMRLVPYTRDDGPCLCVMLSEPGAGVIDNPPTLGGGEDGRIDHTTAQEAGEPSRANRESGLVSQIVSALDEDGLRIAFQPIVSLVGDSQEHYSVLLRMLDENDLMLSAQTLLGPAARSGHLPNIDRWVIQRALGHLTQRRRNGDPFNFFLSLSAETIQDDHLLIWICDTLRESEARAQWVTFQFREQDAHMHTKRIRRLVDGLKKIRSRIAISGFGMVPQPERILEAIPADFVKIDPGLTNDLVEDERKQARLTELAESVHEHSARCIVGGVEDARSLTLLWNAHVDYVQGNFLQQPSTRIDAPA